MPSGERVQIHIPLPYKQKPRVNPRVSRLLVGQEMKQNQFLFEQLALKPEQVKALKERTIPFRAEIDRRRQEVAAKRKELIALVRSEKPDETAVHAAISEISGMQEEMQRMITAHMIEIKASLDKDSQRKFLDLIERRMTGGAMSGCSPDGHGH